MSHRQSVLAYIDMIFDDLEAFEVLQLAPPSFWAKVERNPKLRAADRRFCCQMRSDVLRGRLTFLRFAAELRACRRSHGVSGEIHALIKVAAEQVRLRSGS